MPQGKRTPVEKVACIIVDALLTNPTDAARKHHTSHVSVSRYLERFRAGENELVRHVQEKLPALDAVLNPPHEPLVQDVIREGRAFLMKAFKSLSPHWHENVNAVAVAVGILEDKDMARQALEVMLDEIKSRSTQNGRALSGSHPAANRADSTVRA